MMDTQKKNSMDEVMDAQPPNGPADVKVAGELSSEETEQIAGGLLPAV
jgi:hypothetical protein